MRDLIEEHAQGSLLRQKQIDALVGEGIPPLALTNTLSGLWSMVRADRVVFSGDTFEFARHTGKQVGVGAYTFTLFGDDGEPIDIAAWRPPEIATWRGHAYALGQENAYYSATPLYVHVSVTEWFRHGRGGLYILKPAEAALALLNEVLGVQDERQARALRSKLTIKPPRIDVVEFAVPLPAELAA